jgi:hypothetical protein
MSRGKSMNTRRDHLPARGRQMLVQLRPRGCGRGQSGVEFAFVATIAMIVLFVAVQFAMIGRAALALAQMTYQGARYASVHPDCDKLSCTNGETGIQDFMLQVGSPTFSNNSANLTVNVSLAPPRNFGDSVTISSTFTLPSSVLVLPNPFFGIPFPGTLTSTQTAMSE